MDLDALSDEQLRDEVTTWAGRVAAGEAVLLSLVGELEARGAWAVHGVLSCAHWLSWRLNLTPATAREKVRVARALRPLPQLQQAFAAGAVSYAQVRAITRVATAADEHTWVELARHATAAQLEKATQGVNAARRHERRAADPDAEAWRMRPRVRHEPDGTVVLTLRIPPEHAPLVLAALEAARQAEQADRDAALAELATQLASDASAEAASCAPATHADVSAETPEPYEFVEPPYPDLPPRISPFQPRPAHEDAALDAYWDEVRRRRAKADAWRAHQDQLAHAAAARGLPDPTATLTDGLIRLLTHPDHTPVRLQLLLDPLTGWARTSDDTLLAPTTLHTLLQRHDQGRADRLVGPALRRLLGQLDGERCRLPGCTRTRTLHAHHVRYWQHDGPTDLANLVLVCSRHHTLIHNGELTLTLHPDRRLEVHSNDGTSVPHHPALPARSPHELDPTDAIGPDTLPTSWTGERMDLGYVVNVLMQHAA
jgi:hypothetical protein